MRIVLLVLAGAVAVLLIFKMGEVYGYAKAGFSGRFGENFRNAFDDPRSGPHFGFEDGYLSSGHGAVGKIISFSAPELVIEGPDNVEKVAVLDGTTLIRKFRDEATTTDLAAGQSVVVLGEPGEDGRIRAKLIRILPPPGGSAQ